MIIKVNGKAKEVNERANLLGLVKGMGLSCDRIVLEYNFRVVPMVEWEDTILEENGNLEIVSFVGGG